MFTKFLLFVLFQSSAAVIYRLNDTEYARMPPLFHLDGYEECFDEPDSMYCFAEFALVSDEPNELYTVLQEYSDLITHYNHTVLRYGFCMKKTCSRFFNASGSDLDQRSSLEACINETVYKKYKLKSKLSNDVDCAKRDRDIPIDNVDLTVAVFCMVIVLANLVGSLCDRYFENGKHLRGLKYLYCFSVFRNWKKFVVVPGEGQDPRYIALRGIHGFRSINTCMVVSAHAFFTGAVFIVNPKTVEDMLQMKFYAIFLNGPLIMQTYFIISAFLLVYNWLIESEKREPSWKSLPKQFLLRWLRLTPSYGLIIALTCTWFGRLSSGPYWQKVVNTEVEDCRSHWWRHILYINNYIHGSYCMPQTWYLAADTQLYFLGIILFMICRPVLTRKVVLSLLFVAGIIVPVLQTYYQGLNGILLSSPDTVINLFRDDTTFNYLYVSGQANLCGYIIGMSIAYFIYDWQKAGGNPKQFWKYRYIYWSLIFVGLLIDFSGSIFLADVPPQPYYIHMLYAGFMKPSFGIVIAIIICGVIIQFEGIYRSVLEWQPFTYVGRLSFSAYLLHIAFVRTEIASQFSIQRISLIGVMLKSCTIILSTFVAAFFFWMLVESPFANVIGDIFRKPRTPGVEENKETVKESKKTEDDNGIDMTQTKTEDATIVIKIGNPNAVTCT